MEKIVYRISRMLVHVDDVLTVTKTTGVKKNISVLLFINKQRNTLCVGSLWSSAEQRICTGCTTEYEVHGETNGASEFLTLTYLYSIFLSRMT